MAAQRGQVPNHRRVVHHRRLRRDCGTRTVVNQARRLVRGVAGAGLLPVLELGRDSCRGARLLAAVNRGCGKEDLLAGWTLDAPVAGPS